MNYDDFFKIVDIKDEQKESAKYYLDHRGLDEHIAVANFLQSFKTEKVTYTEVATTFRYDKRIRNILYKYIGYIEETIRAYISNTFPAVSDLPTKAYKDISKMAISKANGAKETYVLLSYCLFSNLLDVFNALGSKHISNLFPYIEKYLKKNTEALCILRNQVGHCKFLLKNNDLKEVTLPLGEINNSLISNLRNFMTFLPEDVRGKFIREINESKNKRANKLPKQVEWNLPNNIVLSI